MPRGSGASRFAELEAGVNPLKLSVRAVEFDLRRRREALRRRKAALPVDLDNLIKFMSRGSSNKGRIVEGRSPVSGLSRKADRRVLEACMTAGVVVKITEGKQWRRD